MNAGLVGDVGRLFSWALKCFISVGGVFMRIFNLKNIIAKSILKHGGCRKVDVSIKKNMRQISLINIVDLLDFNVR